MKRGAKPLLALLIGGAALAASPAGAQDRGTDASDPRGVTVKGQQMPQAEAPRSATCEALARDPWSRAMISMGRMPLVPTRMPRNPDYSAAPLTPPGSPLPSLPKSRFGVRSLVFSGAVEPGASSASAVPEDVAVAANDLANQDDNRIENAVATCRGLHMRGIEAGGLTAGTGYIDASSSAGETSLVENPLGTPYADPLWRVAAANGRHVQARAMIAANDTTLPMAFALFDQRRYAESLDWFRKAAGRLTYAEGGDEAMLFIGKLYLQGLGDKSDPAEGVKWLKKAATGPFNPVTETPVFDPRQPERNTAAGEAAVILANVYRTGFPGVARDPAEARRWYDRARKLGHIPAAKVLGDLYYKGIGTPRDAKKAAEYYREAAQFDYVPAQLALADILYNGEPGVPQDRKKALAWYSAAARHDDPQALYALARAYDLGEGVRADQQKALGFYKSAALQGSAPAKVALGTYFYEGKLVPKDDATARQWFEAGVADEDADGMFDLAAMLARGEGGGKDLVRAWALFRRAAVLGHDKAPQAMAALEKRMTVEEREKAAALFRTL